MNIQELIDRFELLIPKSLLVDDLNMYIYIEAQLVFFYNNCITSRDRRSLYGSDETGAKKILYNSTLKIEDDIFEKVIERFVDSNFFDMNLFYLLEKIDLMENLDIN